MGIVSGLVNGIRAIVGIEQEFGDLLRNKDVTRAMGYMVSHGDEVKRARLSYDVATHVIQERPDKVITDKEGRFVRYQEQAKLGIPYPVYINEIALVMLFGRPVKWVQEGEGCDMAFARFLGLISSTRFDSRIRKCKRLAGAERESALLLHVYRGDDGKASVLLKCLAKSLGDDIRTLFDQYDRLVAFGRGYWIREHGKSVYCFDVYTNRFIYRCRREGIGWSVVEDENLVGKIPVVYFYQDAEHGDVQGLIEREEMLASTTADVNDYFASPTVVLTADVIANMPEKGAAGKVIVLEGEDSRIEYLTWDSTPEAKKMEFEYLQKNILSKSFTPNIDFDNIKGMSNISGKALKQMMILADIKADRGKELYGEMLSRFASLLVSVIGNVLDVSLAKECEGLRIGCEFQEPFGEDISELIGNLIKVYQVGGMSTESFVEKNPLIHDAKKELDRLARERADKAKEEEARAKLDGFTSGF